MIYYAVIYLKNGEIHLKPFDTKEDADECIATVADKPRYKDQIDVTKVVKKDPSKEWFKSVNGYWLWNYKTLESSYVI